MAYLVAWHVGLVPWPGIKPGLPILGEWSLSHWTTGKVSDIFNFKKEILRHTEDKPHEDGCRVLSDESTRQEIPMMASNHQERPLRLQKKQTLLIPWFQISGLLNHESRNFCYFKSPGWWWLVVAVLETSIAGSQIYTDVKENAPFICPELASQALTSSGRGENLKF